VRQRNKKGLALVGSKRIKFGRGRGSRNLGAVFYGLNHRKSILENITVDPVFTKVVIRFLINPEF
jgi:hypothetical protein